MFIRSGRVIRIVLRRLLIRRFLDGRILGGRLVRRCRRGAAGQQTQRGQKTNQPLHESPRTSRITLQITSAPPSSRNAAPAPMARGLDEALP